MHSHGHWPRWEQVRAPRRGGHFLQLGCKVGRAENALWPWLLPGSQRELSEVACVTQRCPSPFEVSYSQESLPTRKEMTDQQSASLFTTLWPYFLRYFSLANISFPIIPSCSWYQSTLWASIFTNELPLALLSTLMYAVAGIKPRAWHTYTLPPLMFVMLCSYVLQLCSLAWPVFIPLNFRN